MAIYLGDQIISSNPTGTGALYLGEQNICTAYLGAVQIFDNCAVANTNVRLNITGSYQGNATGQITENPPDGYTVSGQPGASGTFTLSTPTYPGTGYFCVGGCPDVNPKSVPYTFPASGTTVVTSSRSGGLSSNVAQATVTLTLNDSITPVGGFGTAFTYSSTGASGGGNQYTLTGAVGDPYTFTISSSVISPYTGTINDPSGGSITGTFPNGGANISNTFTGTLIQPSYTLTAGTPTYSGVTGGTAGSNFSVVTLDPSFETKVAGDTYTFTQSGGVAASGWQWNTGPSYTYTIGGIGGKSLSGTMQSGYDGQTLEVAVSGTGQSVVNSITLGGVPRSCANYSCIIPGAGSQQSTTWYYTGSFGVGTVLWSGSGLTGSNPAQGFWANLSGSGSVEYGASGVSSTPSCVSSLNFTTLRFASSAINACNASPTENVYLDGGALTTASSVFTDSIGCSAGSNGYYSDGTYVRFASGGTFTTFASC